eukprot:3189400-Pleurochrysis_carterae.AAC.1
MRLRVCESSAHVCDGEGLRLETDGHAVLGGGAGRVDVHDDGLFGRLVLQTRAPRRHARTCVARADRRRDADRHMPATIANRHMPATIAHRHMPLQCAAHPHATHARRLGHFAFGRRSFWAKAERPLAHACPIYAL